MISIMLHHYTHSITRWSALFALLTCAVTPPLSGQVPVAPVPAAPVAPVQRGYLSGEVIEKATARPLPVLGVGQPPDADRHRDPATTGRNGVANRVACRKGYTRTLAARQ